MSAVVSAVLRGGLVLGSTLLGLTVAAAGLLWVSVSTGALIAVAGLILSFLLLWWLYGRRPSPARGVALVGGVLALMAIHIVGLTAARDIVMTRVGVDARAIVDRTWISHHRNSTSHHCTLRTLEGAPLPDRLATNCEGYRRGDTIQIVMDPEGRFAPVGGPKSDLPTVGETQVVGVALLVFLFSVVIGSLPRKRRPDASWRRRPRTGPRPRS